MNFKILILILLIILPIYFCTGNSEKSRDSLYQAVLKEDVPQVQEMLSSINVNMQNEGGMTLLHQASRLGNLEIAQMLVDKGANVNAKTFFNFIPLHFACMYGHPKVVKLLLDKGSKVEAKNDYQVTPVFYITRHAEPVTKEILSHMIKYKANLDTEDQFGRTLLTTSLFRPDYNEVIELLIKSGADINKRGGLLKHKPIYLATLRQNEKAVKHLLKRGADPNVQSSYGFIETPLTVAALLNNNEIVKLLVQYGAEINVLQMQYDSSSIISSPYPLNRAIFNNNLEMVRFLVEKGASIQAKNDLSLRFFYLHVPKNLRKKFYKDFVPPEEYKTIMDFFNTDKVYKYYRNEPFQYNPGIFPLLLAIEKENFEIIQYLLDQGADPNANKGEPLKSAIEMGNKKMVRILVAKGAKTTMTISEIDKQIDLEKKEEEKRREKRFEEWRKRNTPPKKKLEKEK